MKPFKVIENPEAVPTHKVEVAEISAACNGNVVVTFNLREGGHIFLEFGAESCERLVHGVPRMLADAQAYARSHTTN